MAVHVELAADVSPKERELVVRIAEDELERLGWKAERDRGAAKRCRPGSRCFGALLAKHGAEEALLARIIGGASRLRVTLTRAQPGKGSADARADLEQEDRAQWTRAIGAALERLYPPPSPPVPITEAPAESPADAAPLEPALAAAPLAPPPEPVLSGPVPAEGAGLSLGSILCFSGAGALLATSAVLFLSAESSLSDLEARQTRDASGRISGISRDEAAEAYDSIDLRRHASAGSLALGAGLAAVGILLYAVSDGEPVVVAAAASGGGVLAARF